MLHRCWNNDKYFEYIYPLLHNWLNSVENLENLWLINLVLMEKIYNLLQIETQLVILPSFDKINDSTCKIIKQVQSMKCDTYLSGTDGKEYLKLELFEKEGIGVKFQDTELLYNSYPQSILSLISEFGIAKVLEILRSDKI